MPLTKSCNAGFGVVDPCVKPITYVLNNYEQSVAECNRFLRHSFSGITWQVHTYFSLWWSQPSHQAHPYTWRGPVSCSAPQRPLQMSSSPTHWLHLQGRSYTNPPTSSPQSIGPTRQRISQTLSVNLFYAISIIIWVTRTGCVTLMGALLLVTVSTRKTSKLSNWYIYINIYIIYLSIYLYLSTHMSIYLNLYLYYIYLYL